MFKLIKITKGDYFTCEEEIGDFDTFQDANDYIEEENDKNATYKIEEVS